MRLSFLNAGLACFVAAYGLTTAPEAQATTTSTYVFATGSGCQLSIPTTNTGVRPRATGFRNESTTVSNFVICPMPSPNSSGFTSVIFALYSLDGVSRDVTCTAVKNWFGSSPTYSSKTLAVTTTTAWQNLTWDASDFGGTAGDPVLLMSVTCLLPPQTAVDAYNATYNSEIGA